MGHGASARALRPLTEVICDTDGQLLSALRWIRAQRKTIYYQRIHRFIYTQESKIVIYK